MRGGSANIDKHETRLERERERGKNADSYIHGTKRIDKTNISAYIYIRP